MYIFSGRLSEREIIVNVSFVALLSLRSILLKIVVSISSSAATFRNGSPSSSRLFHRKLPKDFIYSILFGQIYQKQGKQMTVPLWEDKN